tara:strand:+ start:4661 stop:7936 length:3276 start_codon:yes stop_codon:yes gene_type:complete
MVEYRNPILNRGYTFSTQPKEKPTFVQTVSAMNRERYSSILDNAINFMEFGHVVAEEGVHPDEPKYKVWTAWEDEDTRDYYFDPKYFGVRKDLTEARNKDHFFRMIEHIDQKHTDLNTIQNSTWGNFIGGLVLDPVNAVTIPIPIAKSKSVFDAIVKSSLFAGATVAPIELARWQTDPLVTGEEAALNTGGSILLSAGIVGGLKGIGNRFRAKAIKQAERETQAFFKAVYANDTPMYKTESGEVVSGTRLARMKEIDMLPTIEKPEAIHPNAYLNSFLYKGLTNPEKRILLDMKLPNIVHSTFNKLGSSWTYLLNKNVAGVPTEISVNLRAGPNRAKWISIEDQLRDLYRKDTGITPIGAMDYKIYGWGGFREWTKDINKKYVTGKVSELTKTQKEGLDIMIPFWKDWGAKLEEVGMIGTRRSITFRLESTQAHLARLQDDLSFAQKDAKLKSSVNWYKQAIKDTQEKIQRFQNSLDNITKEVMPANEVFYFPRFWNYSKINANRQELESIITDWFEKNPYVWKDGKQVKMPFDRASASKRAKETVTNILNERDWTFDSTYSGSKSMHTKHRVLDIPNYLVYEFIEQDPIQVMQAYTSKIAPQYEFRKAFGGKTFEQLMHNIRAEVEKTNGIKRANQVVRDFDTVYRRVVTSVLDEPDSMSQKIRRVLVDMAQFNFLGSAGFSTLPDYAAILMQREMGAFFKLAFSILEKDKILLNAKEARLSGEAIDIRLGQVQQRLADEISNSPFDRSVYDRLSGKAKQVYFAANLLAPMTTIAKKLEGTLRAHQIIEDSIKWSKGNLSAKDIKINASMGWSIKEAKEIAKLVEKGVAIQKTNAGLWIPNSTEWLENGIKQTTLDKFRSHMNAGIFNTVIMSSPTDKPIIMDGVVYVPWKVAQLIPYMKEDKIVKGYSRIENGLLATPFTFYSYTFGALSKITARMTQGTLHNRAIGIVAAMGLAYMGLQLRYRNKPYILENMSMPDKIARSFDYSGLGAIYSDLFYKAITTAENLGYPNQYIQPKYISRDESERMADALLEPAGAPLSWAFDVSRSVRKIAEGDFGEGTNDLLRTMPFWRLWFLENETKELGRVLNRF